MLKHSSQMSEISLREHFNKLRLISSPTLFPRLNREIAFCWKGCLNSTNRSTVKPLDRVFDLQDELILEEDFIQTNKA